MGHTSDTDDENSPSFMVPAFHDVDNFVFEEGLLLVFGQQAIQQKRIVALEFSYAPHLNQNKIYLDYSMSIITLQLNYFRITNAYVNQNQLYWFQNQ